MPTVIPSPSRNLAIPRSTSQHPTIPHRGGPWSLFQKSSPMIYAKYAKTISDDFPGENMEYGPKVRHSCESRNPEGPILGEVRLLKQTPCGRPLRHSTPPHAPPPLPPPLFPFPFRCSREGGNPSPPSYPHLSFRVPRGISSPTPPLFPRRRESIPSSLPLMPNPIPQPYPPPKVPSPLMGEG